MFATATNARTKNNAHEATLIDLLRRGPVHHGDDSGEEDDFFNTKKIIPGTENKENSSEASANPGKDDTKTHHTVVTHSAGTVDMTVDQSDNNNDGSSRIEVDHKDLTIEGGKNTLSPDRVQALAHRFERPGQGNHRNGHNRNQAQQ